MKKWQMHGKAYRVIYRAGRSLRSSVTTPSAAASQRHLEAVDGEDTDDTAADAFIQTLDRLIGALRAVRDTFADRQNDSAEPLDRASRDEITKWLRLAAQYLEKDPG